MNPRKGGERTQARLEEARLWLRRHHAEVEPDSGFAARVASRLRRDPTADLGLAALRLLPVSVAFALVLALLATLGPKSEEPKVGPDLDVVEWVYDESVSSP